jgi:hypothetical protein
MGWVRGDEKPRPGAANPAMSLAPAVAPPLQSGRRMRTSLGIALLVVAACSGDGGHARVDGGDDGPDAGDDCTTGPTVERGAFIAASVDYLQAAFATDESFAGGDVVYGEMWVPLVDSGCPVADWSTLSYQVELPAALAPEELRADFTRVAVVWTLGGRKLIVYLDTSGAPGATGEWQGGRLPDSFAAVPADGADAGDIQALATQLQADHPTLAVSWLEGVRVLTVDGTVGHFAVDTLPATLHLVGELEAAAAAVRTSGLFPSVEWSGLVFRIPNESRLGQVIDDATLRPECLRAESKPLLEQLTTSPALAPPLGPGIASRQPVCP